MTRLCCLVNFLAMIFQLFAQISKATAILDEAGWKMSGEYRVRSKLTLTITTTKDREYDVVLRLFRSGVSLGLK